MKLDPDIGHLLARWVFEHALDMLRHAFVNIHYNVEAVTSTHLTDAYKLGRSKSAVFKQASCC